MEDIIKEKFINADIEYFWELEPRFGRYFLPQIFPKAQRKCSLAGEGMFNLVFLNNKIYDLDFRETKLMLPDDGRRAFRDPDKDELIDTIVSKLKEYNIPYTVNSGKFICMKIQNYIAKVEIVKKTKEPQ